jgi:hypothetical protein
LYNNKNTEDEKKKTKNHEQDSTHCFSWSIYMKTHMASCSENLDMHAKEIEENLELH